MIMFRNRSFLHLCHRGEVSVLRKTSSETCSLHKITLNLHPRRIPVPYRKWHEEMTSADIRNWKASLAIEHVSKTGPSEMDQNTTTQKRNLLEFISSKTSATEEDWDALLRDILNTRSYLNESNINGLVMQYCATFRNLNLAKSYLRYMKKHGKKFNKSVMIEFLRTCYSCEPILTEEDRKVVRSFSNYLISNIQKMDLKLASGTVKGLSILNEWKKCLEVVENLEKSGISTNSQLYSPVIKCLFNNQQVELGRKIMLEYLNQKKNLHDTVYTKWIEIFRNDPHRLEELLVIFKDYNVIPKKFTLDYLIEIYSKLLPQDQRKGEYTIVTSDGRCQSCMKTLEKNMLRKDEFKELRDAFLNRVLVDNDVFKNTTLAEVQSFYKVVKTHAPFDIVIDGLNVMYCRNGNDSLHDKSSRLQNAVHFFFQRDKKIFVVGRKHMRNLPKRVMEDIKEKSTVFLIDNESEDDPFVIYSTLYSGLQCCFVSNDYFRSEKFRLKDHRLSDLFKRWQLSHQITVPKSFKTSFEPPLQFKLCAQKATPLSWHIPYHDNDYTGSDQYTKDDLTKWLCLRKLK